MARKPIKSSRAPTRTKPSPTVPSRIRMPRSWRVVTARVLRPSMSDAGTRASKREVPEIRLSGAWLARVGFPKGRRYLISADAAFETIYLQADLPDAKDRRRR